MDKFKHHGASGPSRLECWIPQAEEVSSTTVTTVITSESLRSQNLARSKYPRHAAATICSKPENQSPNSLPSMGAVGLAIGSTWQPDPYIAVMAVVEFDGALELRVSRQKTTKNHVRDGNEHDLRF